MSRSPTMQAVANRASVQAASNPSSPSPFHSSFRPTLTAATVTTAAASGRPAAPAASTTSTLGTGSVFGATTTPAPSLFTAAAPTPSTRPSLFGPVVAPAATSAVFGMFGNLSNTTPTSTTSSTTATNGAWVFGTTPASSVTSAAQVVPATASWRPSATLSSPEVRSIDFRFQWNPIMIAKGQSFSQTVRAQEKPKGAVSFDLSFEFECSVKRIENCYLFSLKCSTDEDLEQLKWANTATLISLDSTMQCRHTVTSWTESRMISISGPIEMKRFQLCSDGLYKLDITLSNERLSASTSTSMTPGTNHAHCDSILSRMLDDESSHDVFFEFEVPVFVYEDAVTEKRESIVADKREEDLDPAPKVATNNEETKTDQLTDDSQEKDVHEEQEKGEDTDENADVPKGENNGTMSSQHNPGVKEEDSVNSTASGFENEKEANHRATFKVRVSTQTRTETVSAHKIVLCHFEYFKTMFSGPFAEGGPGVKRIKIKDADICCFRLLIEFLYLGQLRLTSAPIVLTEDQAEDDIPTWEDVYLVSDRYDIPELRRMALLKILGGLDSAWAIPFLFRTAYLFDEMRLPVIKFLVRNCVTSIVDKNLQKKYYDHPECSSIFGEIITELWSASAWLPRKLA